MSEKFWQSKTLDEFSVEEWEAVCDGCGLCCLVKIEDEDSGAIYNTSVSCKLLDTDDCRCRDYTRRFAKAPMCTQLTLANLSKMNWLPETCAYKRLLNGQPLPEWHYLNTDDRSSVHDAGVSVKWFAQSEEYIHPDQLIDFVINDEE